MRWREQSNADFTGLAVVEWSVCDDDISRRCAEVAERLIKPTLDEKRQMMSTRRLCGRRRRETGDRGRVKRRKGSQSESIGDGPHPTTAGRRTHTRAPTLAVIPHAPSLCNRHPTSAARQQASPFDSPSWRANFPRDEKWPIHQHGHGAENRPWNTNVHTRLLIDVVYFQQAR